MPFRNAASEAGRITFTRASAERIAGAVQVVESQRPATRPLTFEPFLEKPSIFRVGVVATAWPKNGTATVTLDRSGRTVQAHNKLVSLPTGRAVNIAKDGTAWYLVSYEIATATATFISSSTRETVRVVSSSSGTSNLLTYLTGVSAALNTATCVISMTLTTATASVISASATQSADITSFTTYTASYMTLGG